ncbi:MAG: helix-turn-helix transcriptional regulator [Marinobacter adhaerens]
MTTDHSILVYGQAFRPLDHWERVLPGVGLVEAGGDLQRIAPPALLWVCIDVPEWKTLVRDWSDRGGKVAVLTRQPEPEEMNRVLACGARAYLPALSNERVFQQVAETVRAGGLWFPEQLLASLLKTVASALESAPLPSSPADLSALSAREHQVALLAAKGSSNRNIATKLGITERTVKEHMGSIFKKLAVRDRMQLMLLVTGQQNTGAGDDVRQA